MAAASRGNKALGKRQLQVARLKRQVAELAGKQGGAVKEAYGKVFWARFDRNALWLPCVAVPPEALTGNRAHLVMAKEALASKRDTVVVYWFVYGTLSKQTVQGLQPLDTEHLAPDPNEGERLSARNRSFLRAALTEAAKTRGQSREALEQLIKAAFDAQTAGASDAASTSVGGDSDDEEANVTRKRSRPHQRGPLATIPEGARFSVTAGAVTCGGVPHWDIGGDGLEPRWDDAAAQVALSRAATSGSKGADTAPPERDDASATGPNANGNSAGGPEDDQGEAASSDQASEYDGREEESDDEDEDEEDDYVPDGAARKRKAARPPKRPAPKNPAKRKKGAKAAQAPAKTSLTDHVRRWKVRLEAWKEQPNPEPGLARVVSTLEKMARMRVSTKLLTKTGIGSTVAALRKSAHPHVSTLAKAVRKIWVAQLKEKAAKSEAGTAPNAEQPPQG